MIVILLFNLLFRSMSSFRGVRHTAVQMPMLRGSRRWLLSVSEAPDAVSGDINIHVRDPDDFDARRFGELLSSFDMVQHVVGAIHRCGGTLDLVMTFDASLLEGVSVDPPHCFRSLAGYLLCAC